MKIIMFVIIKRIGKRSIYLLSQKEIDAVVQNVGWRAESYMPHMSARYRPPIRCKQTFLHVNVYKYDCLNPGCDCMVFMEELPFAKASQVRTDALNISDNPDVEEVGNDDVVIRKGQTYATAIYDLKDHHLIALLDGREGESLKKWLEHLKDIFKEELPQIQKLIPGNGDW